MILWKLNFRESQIFPWLKLFYMYKTLVTVFFLFPFLINAQVVSNSDENKVFEKIEIEACFPGGTAKWIAFVKTNFNFTRIEKSLSDSVTLFSDTAKIQFLRNE